ncbi:hypothetical protein GE061_017246 [Apolygus lucorum]|uniref:CHK kinase-like domain-containing protein n=1 Tax=Apolygus lucorum TaxID=248454 RepID=A0A8S9XCK5_APOLU|nr:hypothetical protein GE061_017246 [Apolygus lucorum]
MELDESWLDAVLKKKSFQDSIVKIKSISVTDALGKGENYLSLIKRVKADVILGSGRRKKMSLIVKQQYESPLLKQMSVANGYFAREIGMYRDILPKMEELMDEVGDGSETLWGRCMEVRLFDRIIFEDLNAQGYVMAARRDQLNFKTASFVLRCLGKFHAMGAVLNERLEIPSDMYWKHPWTKMLELYRNQFKGTLYKMADLMEKWGDEWKESKPKLVDLIPAYWSKFEDYLTQPLEGLKVLAHGDCWTNNMLFKYDVDPAVPVSMKFLDLQISYMTTPCHDLHWFLVSSVPLATRKSQLGDLLQTYADSLLANLEKFGYAGEKPTVQSIEQEFEKYKFMSFVFGSILAAPVLNEKKDALDIESMMEKGYEAKVQGQEDFVYDVFANLSEGAINLLKNEIQDLLKNGVYWSLRGGRLIHFQRGKRGKMKWVWALLGAVLCAAIATGHDKHWEKGGGESHHADHHSSHGEKGDHGYKKEHGHHESKKGHHHKDHHKGGFEDHGGHKHKHHDEGGYHHEHHKGEKGHKGHKFDDSGSYKKGHSTKGKHEVHKLDEYHKKNEFYDEHHDGGHHEEHGGYHKEHGHKHGGHHKKGHHKSGHHHGEKGHKGHHHKGHHHHNHHGHKKAGGHDEHYGHHHKHGKKGGHDEHKHWGYKKHGH